MAETLNFTLSSSVVSGSTTLPSFNPPFSFSDVNLQQHSSDKVVIAAAQSDFAISLDGMTGRYVFLKFDNDVSVKLNGTGNTAIALAASASSPAGLLVIGGAVTSVHVTTTVQTICEKFIAT